MECRGQVKYLPQDIEDAFQEKNKKVLATFFDLTKAFHKVWKEGLLLKPTSMGIQGNMYNWIQNVLTRTHARVKLNGKRSKLVHLQEGVPQGGVISPTLFIIFINHKPTVSIHPPATACRWPSNLDPCRIH